MPLDPKVKEILDSMQALGAAPLHTMSVAAARAMASSRTRDDLAPDYVSNIKNREIPGPGGELGIRIYTPDGTGPFPILLYFHGGGFVLCNLDTHDHICSALCKQAQSIVISLDYRLAPENRFPAAVDDCLAATCWVAEHAEALNGDPSRIAVAGDSCGGNLATVTAIRIRDEGGPRLCGQLLIYPITDYYEPATKSYIENADGYFLTREGMIWFMDHYLNSRADAENPHASPLRCRDLSRLPPALVITAEYDPIRDEGVRYAERLRAAGVDAIHSPYKGMIHGFYGNIGILEQAHQAIKESCEWLQRIYSS